ncbi:hypothetical protein HJC23_011928 [Cyclotella cryptica]|uniref:Methyltransferase domain-containing protein n=1 Tax=Cyclotella cryptica TaxID=29204 RepID=A0ABD3NKC9_9STRA
MRRINDGGSSVLVLLLIGAANLFAVFQLLARQGGEELQTTAKALEAVTATLKIKKTLEDAVISTATAGVELKAATAALIQAKEELAATQGSSSDCESVLDKLDTQFDARRKARQELPFTANPDYPQGTFDKWEPEAICFADERFGNTVRYKALGDGPKFVCGVDFLAKKSKNEGCLVYSVGSNNDISFEQAVHSIMGCEIHTFDPYIPKDKFVGNDIVTFHQWGFGEDNSTQGPTFKSAATVMKELHHTHRAIDIFKIDCEGCEFAVMPPLLESISKGIVNVNQLQIEIHRDAVKENTTLLEAFFAAADKANLRIFHKERNQWGCMGYLCVEYAFVNEKFLRDVNGEYVCHKV